jgi:hypothetical protein
MALRTSLVLADSKGSARRGGHLVEAEARLVVGAADAHGHVYLFVYHRIDTPALAGSAG